MKKLLAAVLAVACALSLGSVAVFAADADYVVDLDTAYFDNGNAAAYDGANTVMPNKTLYFELPSVFTDDGNGNPVPGSLIDASLYTDSDFFKAKFDKGDDNTKMIKSMALSEKNINGNRGPWLEVKLQDDWTDDEYKINPFVKLTAKEDIGFMLDGEVLQFNVGNYYISNQSEDADQDYSAGTGGVVLKPTEDDDNEITWEDENNTIARLTFTGDSDTDKFFPKLSTKWDNSDYEEYFADQNAFIFDFVAHPTISSTSRATLELYNPYYDADEDDLTVAPEDVIIYEVDLDSGELIDVTDKFTAGENDDGDYVFTTRTRTLGTYIMAEAAVIDDAADDTTEDGGKEIPSTGR